MVQTKEMKNYKTEVTDNNRIEYLHFFGIKYPFIETDGMKIASDELEYAIRNHPNSPEVPKLLFQLLASVPSCRVVVKETADLGVGLQYAFRFCKIGNGVQYDIVLCVQSRVLRIVFYSDGKE